MLNLKYIHAQKILNFYMEKLEDDDSSEAKWALQWLHLQMAKFKCNNILDMLKSYPLEISDIDQAQ
jgi:hypothetical protein